MRLKIPPMLQALMTIALMIGLRQGFPQAKINTPLRGVWSLLLGFIGLGFALQGVQTFRQAQTTTNPLHPEKSSALVTTGVYTLTRNPMYVGMAFILTAIAIYLQNLMAYLGVPTFVAYLTYFQIMPEEEMLLQLFGDDYRAYCTRVRRWL